VPKAGTVPSAQGVAAGPPVGVVTGAPRRWLGLEGLVLLAGALIAFGALGQPWWLVPAAILAPDIAMSGYLAGPRPGAHVYNLTHATPLPAVMLGAGYWQADRLVMALALVWLAHIGLDRLLGTGLKYNDRFTHTHLGDRPDARSPGSQAATARRLPPDRSASRRGSA
jgi:hypothetical protein